LECRGLQRIEQRLHPVTDELARGFTLDRHRPPYPGIHAFEAEDAAIYFGRERQPDPKGDRVKLTLTGKFLPYKEY
jgi:hypothetical protein